MIPATMTRAAANAPVALLAVIAYSGSIVQSEEQSEGRRNVIFILSDDHRYDVMDRLEKTGGMQIPVRRGNWQAVERRRP